jgi:hypothetical protein
MGRPAFPDGAAIGQMVPVRLSQEELDQIAKVASLSNQKLSDQMLPDEHAAHQTPLLPKAMSREESIKSCAS